MLKLATLSLAAGIIYGSCSIVHWPIGFILLKWIMLCLLGLNLFFLTNSKKVFICLLFFSSGDFLYNFNEYLRFYAVDKIKNQKTLIGKLIKMDFNQDGSVKLMFKLERIGFFAPTISCSSWNRNLCLNSIYKLGFQDIVPMTNGMMVRDWVLVRGRLVWQKMIRYQSPALKTWFLENSAKRLDKQTSTLYNAVFLGYKDGNDSTDIKEPFIRSGLIHFMARSGLHVVMISDLVGRFLKLFYIPWELLWLIKLLFLFLYSFFSWPSVSFNRAFLMIVLAIIGQRLGKNIKFDHNFYLALFCTILTNPYQLFCVDFQLSFGLTMALITVLNEKQLK